jgi:RNA polymerase sigma-70 factor (ECF subfamily)
MRVTAEDRLRERTCRVAEDAESTTDRELIERARAGDERAFHDLVERYEPRVAATVVGMLGPGDEAEDVGQETFIRLYRSLDRFRGDSSLGTYLTRIAINLSLTALKRRKRWRSRFVRQDEGEREGPEGSWDPRGQMEREDMARMVRAAVNRLAGDGDVAPRASDGTAGERDEGVEGWMIANCSCATGTKTCRPRKWAV